MREIGRRQAGTGSHNCYRVACSTSRLLNSFRGNAIDDHVFANEQQMLRTCVRCHINDRAQINEETLLFRILTQMPSAPKSPVIAIAAAIVSDNEES
jgi:hypothetical protein